MLEIVQKDFEINEIFNSDIFMAHVYSQHLVTLTLDLKTGLAVIHSLRNLVQSQKLVPSQQVNNITVAMKCNN